MSTLTAVGSAVAVIAPLLTAAGAALPPGTTFAPQGFAELAGWRDDDHAAAMAAFRASCAVGTGSLAAARGARAPGEALVRACEVALSDAAPDGDSARRFFETHFVPVRVIPPQSIQGFFTGYFEPDIQGSLGKTEKFSTSILSRPADLVSFRPEERPAGVPAPLEAARRTADGTLAPYPDRAAIEAGVLGDAARPLAWLDPVDAFFVHIQGSARIRLAGGGVLRLSYAGRNGHPFTAIGRLMIERGWLTREEATADGIRGWLVGNPEAGRRLMRENRSYIFFRVDEGRPPDEGPIGAAGVPLHTGRSLAIDRSVWPYGLPVFVSALLPLSAPGRAEPFRRLMVAHDTGSAIVGPARADLFFGSGAAAGEVAGRIRHGGDFVVLLPLPAAP